MYICNVYLPDASWSINDLHQLIHQNPWTFLLLGDFNSHNPLWGCCAHADSRGRILEQIIEEENLILLNDGSGTYINSRSSNLTAIDLSLCSPRLTPLLKWNVLNEHHATDHLPICIEVASTSSTNQENSHKWKIDKADWNLHRQSMADFHINGDIDGTVEDVTTTIITSAL